MCLHHNSRLAATHGVTRGCFCDFRNVAQDIYYIITYLPLKVPSKTVQAFQRLGETNRLIDPQSFFDGTMCKQAVFVLLIYMFSY